MDLVKLVVLSLLLVSSTEASYSVWKSLEWQHWSFIAHTEGLTLGTLLLKCIMRKGMQSYKLQRCLNGILRLNVASFLHNLEIWSRKRHFCGVEFVLNHKKLWVSNIYIASICFPSLCLKPLNFSYIIKNLNVWCRKQTNKTHIKAPWNACHSAKAHHISATGLDLAV